MYSNAYIYVLPSDVEGMAISLLEAMSYGNCCVVSDIPENIEVVEDKAISFKKGNIEDLREKLEFLINNEEYVKKRVEMYKKTLPKPVVQYTMDGEFVREYSSLKDCERYGFKSGNIQHCCSGLYKSAYGFIWKYK